MVGLVFKPNAKILVAPLFLHEFSIAGDHTRPDIHKSTLRVFFQYVFIPSLWYVLPEFQTQINHETDDADVYIGFEIGRVLGGTTAYVKPGFGLNPDPANRRWGVSFGLRVPF